MLGAVLISERIFRIYVLLSVLGSFAASVKNRLGFLLARFKVFKDSIFYFYNIFAF